MAGLCIGVLGLVVTLEGLRRYRKWYDSHLVRRHRRELRLPQHIRNRPLWGPGRDQVDGAGDEHAIPLVSTAAAAQEEHIPGGGPLDPFRPTVWQQVARSLLEVVEVGMSHLLLLFVVHYNGFVIISTLIGAFLGAFIFQWEKIGNR